MKITIEKTNLIKSINDCLKSVSNKSTNQILTHFKLEVNKENLKLTGSNSDISIESLINVEEDSSTIITVNKIGSICVPARIFSEIIRKSPDDIIDIEVKKNFQIIIKSGKAEFKLSGLPEDEYPKLTKIEENNFYLFRNESLRKIITKTIYAAATSESRPLFTGINWKLQNKVLTCSATDGHRLAKVEMSCEYTENININIPWKTLEELNRLMLDKDGEVKVFFSDNQVLFKVRNILLYSRLLNGVFPDTQRLIPSEITTVLELNKSEFKLAIERAAIFSNESNSNIIKLITNETFVEIISHNPEIGDVFDEIRIDSITGEGIKLSFNAKYMLDVLKIIDEEIVQVKFSDYIRAFIVKGKNDNSSIQLILPVKTV